MRLWIISDLHLEHADRHPRDIPAADVCVVAGDVGVSVAHSVGWLGDRIAKWMPVVYVAGNHEFYGSYIERELREGRLAAERHPDVHLLEDDLCVIGGVRFIGATLWTDYRLGAQTEADVVWSGYAAERGLTDFRTILGLRVGNALTAYGLADVHARSRSVIDQALATPFHGPSVVVTHHAPHPGSVAPEFKGDGLNAAFASDLTELIERRRPNLWVHGHMHNSSDYRVEATRIVCNPRGYRDENAGLDPAKILEV